MPATTIRQAENRAYGPDDMQIVNSFGLAGVAGGIDAPPTVSLALGVDGEIDAPVVMTFDLPQADALVAELQRHIAAVRRAELN